MNRDQVWTMKNGEKIVVRDMTTPHLLNTMALLYRHAVKKIDTDNMFDAVPNEDFTDARYTESDDNLVSKYLPPIFKSMEAEFFYRRRFMTDTVAGVDREALAQLIKEVTSKPRKAPKKRRKGGVKRKKARNR